MKTLQEKTPGASRTVMTDLVLPGETNPLHNLFGGELLARMDRAASIAARRHSGHLVVTASVNHVAFNKTIPLGSVVTIEAAISRAFKTAMEVYMDVWIEDRVSGERSKANEA
ncbi:MAG: acyl-CoA thioesterase, partial [Sinomicrobium sp.]|nr:acyl-CoA thioesterase [Sinomicrobium sp.]